MKATVLFASPRGRESNTMALLRPALETWRGAGHEAEVFSLYDLHIEGCLACRCCQTDWQQPACAIDDDMQPIVRSILRSELVLLATPIYSWYCTAPLKAALDRLVYAMDKYYGSQGRGPALLAGKAMAAVVTCGYRPERGADLFLEGMRRWCRHTEMRWLGALTERHMGYGTGFMDGEKAAHAAEFASQVLIPLSDAAEAAAPAER